MSAPALGTLDARIAALAARDLPLAVSILKEAIRIPADHVDLPAERGGDPLCGLSNHEGPRIEYLLGLPALDHLDKRNRIYGVVMPTARWLYGDRASDELIWKICDVAIKGAQAGGTNMRTVNNALREDFQD